ncbi:MAG: MCE family protein [Gammaproteobacteria bacterium]|nr:MCE family protein [Gammaproteobacteria bacterium]
MRNSLETRLGMFFALALIAGLVVLELAGGFNFFSKGVQVRARFASVNELQVGAPVKLAGVQVGEVRGVSIEDNRVAVTLRLRPDAGVRTDSRAAIRFAGLMGQNYVSLSFGTPGAPVVTEGTELETEAVPDLSQVLSKLDSAVGGVSSITNLFAGDSFQNLLGPLTDFLKDNNPRLSGILSNMNTVSRQIAAGQGTIGRLVMEDQLYTAAVQTVTNMSATATKLQSMVDDGSAAIGEARKLVTDVNAGQGTLGKLVRDEALYLETKEAMSNLKEILQKINHGQGLAGKVVNDETFFKNVKGTLQKVEKATDGLEDQGPISLIGTVVGTLF